MIDEKQENTKEKKKKHASEIKRDSYLSLKAISTFLEQEREIYARSGRGRYDYIH